MDKKNKNKIYLFSFTILLIILIIHIFSGRFMSFVKIENNYYRQLILEIICIVTIIIIIIYHFNRYKYAQSYEDIEMLSKKLKFKNDQLEKINSEMEFRINERTIELKESESRYRNLVEANFEAIIIVDQTIIVDVNIALCNMTKYNREELIGKSILMFFNEINHLDVLEKLKIKDRKNYQYKLMTKFDELLNVEVLSRGFDYKGKRMKVCAIRDISERLLFERTLYQVQETLKRSQKIARLGSFEYDFEKKIIYLSESLRELLAIEGIKQMNINTFINDIVDREYREDVLTASKMMLKDDENHTILFKTNLIKNKKRWLKCESLYTYDEINTKAKVIGVIQDITDQREREFDIQYNLNFLQVLMDTIPNPIFYENRDGIYIGCNQAFADFFDLEKKDIVGSNVFDLVSHEYGEIYTQKDRELINLGGRQIHEGKLLDIDGNERDVVFTKAVYYDLLGQVEGVVGVIADITEYKTTQEQLMILSITDHLTKLYNRVKINEVIEEEIKLIKRKNHSLSLVMFDIDFFKKVNDVYGHYIGDEVLKTLSNIIVENVREIDVVSRWGGEEFMILLRNTDLKNAVSVAEKLRKLIENYHFDKVEKITCSFGVSEYLIEKDKDSAELIVRVDDALYRAKNNGRNRVEI